MTAYYVATDRNSEGCIVCESWRKNAKNQYCVRSRNWEEYHCGDDYLMVSICTSVRKNRMYRPNKNANVRCAVGGNQGVA